MRKIKWIAAIIMIVAMVVNSYAQAPRTPAGQAKQLQLALKLTDMQTNKITVILQQIDKEYANDKALQANLKSWQATHNTKAMIDYILKQMDANAFRIEQVLTPEQDNAFQEMLKKRRDALTKIAAAQK